MFLHLLTKSSVRHPITTLAITAVFAGIFSYGMGQAVIENGFRSYLGDDSPELAILDEFVARFGGGTPVLAVYTCEETEACSTVFDPVPLEMAQRIYQEFDGVDGLTIHTPANARLLVFDGVDHFDWERLYGNPRIDELSALAANDPLWSRTITSRDGQVGAITLQFNHSDPARQREATIRLKKLTDEYAHLFRFRFVGESVDFTLGTDAIKAEQDRVMPGLMIVMCLTIYLLFRSVAAIIPTIAVMGLATVSAQGLMGLLGVAVDATTQNVLSVVLVVGICDAIHFVSRYASSDGPATSPRSEERALALVSVAREIESPCLWTSVTTVAAFLSFLSSSFPSFRYFGVFCAFGVLIALLLTFTVMPVLLLVMPKLSGTRIWDLNAPTANEWWGALADNLVAFASAAHRQILIGAAVLLALSAWGATRVFVDSDIGSLMGAANPLIEWSDWIENNFRSPESLEIELEMAKDTSVLDPLSLLIVEDIEAHLLSDYPDLGPVRSILDPIRRMNFFMSGQTSDGLALPPADEPERLHEIFLQLGGETRDQWAPTGLRHVRLSVEAPSLPTSQQRIIVDDLSQYLSMTLPEGWSFELTGSLPIFEAMMSRLLEMQVKAFLGAIIAVSLCMLAYFGFDWRLTLLALLPNILPVVAVLGFLGWAAIPLDVGTAIIGPMIMGVAVDDSIHLFTEYRHALGRGLGSSQAMRSALTLVERPVITTSGTLCAGFLALAVLTRFGVIQTFGLVFALAVLVALLADLILIPAFVHRFPEYITPASDR